MKFETIKDFLQRIGAADDQNIKIRLEANDMLPKFGTAAEIIKNFGDMYVLKVDLTEVFYNKITIRARDNAF